MIIAGAGLLLLALYLATRWCSTVNPAPSAPGVRGTGAAEAAGATPREWQSALWQNSDLLPRGRWDPVDFWFRMGQLREWPSLNPPRLSFRGVYRAPPCVLERLAPSAEPSRWEELLPLLVLPTAIPLPLLLPAVALAAAIAVALALRPLPETYAGGGGVPGAGANVGGVAAAKTRGPSVFRAFTATAPPGLTVTGFPPKKG